ncbi:MAG: hypothetical protein JW934_15765 [Anaerolineae bacterium]|nr:hypothetical protein [Anaerolineae bacterium]
MFCTNCGTEFLEQANYCWKCGHIRKGLKPPAGSLIYELAWAYTYGDSLHLFCTSDQFIGDTYNQLKELGCIFGVKKQIKNFEDHPREIEIQLKKHVDSEQTEFWLLEKLCRDGWEPFAVTGNLRHLAFRRQVAV